MITKKMEIVNKLGLHARAASVFIKTASAFGSEITISNPEKVANGKSIMSMMLLQAACGTSIEVSIDGDDEHEAMIAIEALVSSGFGEVA